ncbi:MAG: sigma factor [Azospirillaceae bacterium]
MDTREDPSPAVLAAEAAARSSYGRLLAYLAARWRDVAAAEDALAEALARALARWPVEGVPRMPEAWLLTTARRLLISAARRRQVALRGEATVRLIDEELNAMERSAIPDERLKLLFVCAHPAIDPAVHAPLMLQTVLGLDAARIASAFLVSPATMGQRLVRAKARIKASGIGFAVPTTEELAPRLDSVLDAIYAAFGSGWDGIAADDPRTRGLAAEALWLGRVLVGLLPEEPEARGLLALMLHAHARREARRDGDGRFVPLAEQDPDTWDWPLVREAEDELRRAAGFGRLGRYQMEAAIQSAHVQGLLSGSVPWPAIAGLYAALTALTPAIGARVSHAVAVGETDGAAAGLARLDTIDGERVSTYQPYWVARAALLGRTGDQAGARAALERAIGLTEDPAVRAFLLARLS